MSSLQIESLLLSDVSLQAALATSGLVLGCADSKGLLNIFTIGTDGKLYALEPTATEPTGWAETDLGCPVTPTRIAAALDAQGRLVIAAVEVSSLRVFTLREASEGGRRWDPSGWNTIAPGPSVAPPSPRNPCVLYEFVLRNNSAGELEFLLLYFLRMTDGYAYYTYLVGRSGVTAAVWNIGLFLGNYLFEGPQPTLWPSMVLGIRNSLPSLFIAWHEGTERTGGSPTLGVWEGIDAASPPALTKLLSLASNSVVDRLLALGALDNSNLFALGQINSPSESGVFRLNWDSLTLTLISAGPALAQGQGVGVAEPDTSAGMVDILAVDQTGGLRHARGNADGTEWETLSEPIAARVVTVAGMVTPAEGAAFLVASLDQTLFRYYRTPESADWATTEIALPQHRGTQVVWYTTSVTCLDDQQNAFPGCPVTIKCDQTTEIIVNGRTEVVGPLRPLAVTANARGTLTIQQSTEYLRTLFVPDLRIEGPALGSTGTVQAYAETQQRLYRLTATDLLKANILAEDQKPYAERITQALATAASLHLPPRPGTAPLTKRPPEGLLPGQVRFTPKAGGAAGLSSIFDDAGDFFERVKEGLEKAVDLPEVQAFGDSRVESLLLTLVTNDGSYEVIVSTLERAFDAIQIIFVTVVTDPAAVLEWLGTMLDWGAIQERAGRISTLINAGITAIPSFINQSGILTNLSSLFAMLRTQAPDAFAWLKGEIGANSIQSNATQAGYSGEDGLFTVGDHHLDVSANWLLDRLTPYLQELGLNLGSLNGPGWQSFPALLTAIQSGIVGSVTTAAGNVEQLFQNLSASQVTGVTCDQIIEQFQQLVDALLQFFESITQGLADAVNELATGTTLPDLLQTRITIPVVDDLLQTLNLTNGSAVTLMDVISLLAAVPLQTMSPFIPEGTNETYLICALLAFATTATMATNDALPEAKLALVALTYLLLIAVLAIVIADLNLQTDPSIELELAALVDFFYQAFSLFMSITAPTVVQPMAVFSMAEAMVLNVLRAIWAFRNLGTAKLYQMAANHLGTLPGLFRWVDLVWPPPASKPPQARTILALIDVLGQGATAAGFFLDAQPPPPKSS